MTRVFDALKAGAKAVAGEFGPGEYEAAGRAVRCAHCGGQRFVLHATPAGSVGGLYGCSLRCEACTHITLFGDAPRRR